MISMTLAQVTAFPTILLILIVVQMSIAHFAHKKTESQTIWQSSYYISLIAAQTILFYGGFITLVLISQMEISTNILILMAMAFALIFAIIITPFTEASRRFILKPKNSSRTGKRDDKQVIKHYSQRLSSALDIQRLADTVLSLMIETLGVERGVVFLNERETTGVSKLRPLASTGITNLNTQNFSTDSPFIDYFRHNEGILNHDDIKTLPEFKLLLAEERQWLDTLQISFYAPVLRQRELIGVLAFGATGTTYYEEDLDLMKTLANQTALAMDSARLFEQLATINEEVGTLNEQLAGLDKKKGDFLSIASHELRTPLTHIQGYSSILLDLTEEQLQDPAYLKSMLKGIVKGSERLKNVVDVMFDVSEADVGLMSLFHGPVKMEKVIDHAAQSLLPDFDSRRVAYAATGIKALPIVEADGTRLVQAFENLIGNALKYTPDGGLVKLEGSTTTLDGKEAVQILITDTGIGIDPEHHEKIFEKFFRVGSVENHSTGKTKFKGAGPGLGLTLVRGIAMAHNGKVWVESTGHDETNCPGSKFFFVIPTNATATEDEETEVPQSLIETRRWKRMSDEDIL